MRTNSGFVSAVDHRTVKELNENIKIYLLNDPYLVDQLYKLYYRRKMELNELDKKSQMFVELLE